MQHCMSDCAQVLALARVVLEDYSSFHWGIIAHMCVCVCQCHECVSWVSLFFKCYYRATVQAPVLIFMVTINLYFFNVVLIYQTHTLPLCCLNSWLI